MSVEITRRCPLSCPGCYAYREGHLGAAGPLKSLPELEGPQLVAGIISLVDRYRPLHLSIVGGEPLVRWREITQLLPALEQRGIHTQIVTSAVRPIPLEWRSARRLSLVVSVDGLQPEHDKRRAPATYDRILRHVAVHEITVHCTVTRQLAERAGYLPDFVEFWAARAEVRKIWISLYTPQIGESSPEIIPAELRAGVIKELSRLGDDFPKLELPEGLLQVYLKPPANPAHCTFALTTRTISADLKTIVTPCQLGGTPDCRHCGCIASAALEAVGRHRLPVGLRAGTIYRLSRRVGCAVNALRGLSNATTSGTEHDVGTRQESATLEHAPH
jgi:organic radical activating enzyme